MENCCMINMNNIGGIIDMDGFTINKTFYCKEIGMLKMDEEVAISYHFEMPFKWIDLTDKYRKSCSYLIKHIHKLPFHTANALPLNRLDDIVKDFHKNIGEKAIVYKGGHIERDLLKKLNIPGINLEIFGCPKAEHLFSNLIWLETCGHHIGANPYKHCPKVEVEAFGTWLKKQIK